eukprot:6480944-Amphidinium_carterae.1
MFACVVHFLHNAAFRTRCVCGFAAFFSVLSKLSEGSRRKVFLRFLGLLLWFRALAYLINLAMPGHHVLFKNGDSHKTGWRLGIALGYISLIHAKVPEITSTDCL